MEATLKEIPVVQLWHRYKAEGSVSLRNELVLKYTWLVRSIVRRVSSVSGGYTEAEDLMSYGIIGLIKAVEKFDPEKGVTFETFATYRIRGEIIDYMRRNDWVPRNVRKKSFELEETENTLSNELGRAPTPAELAQRLGITCEELGRMISEMERFNVTSFEELIYDTVKVDSDFPSFDTPEGALQEQELLDVLAKILDGLPERERLIITLYYYEELTLKEISDIIGVSESRVSQVHSRAIGRMKTMMAEYVNGNS